jgi:hypothetical protein
VEEGEYYCLYEKKIPILHLVDKNLNVFKNKIERWYKRNFDEIMEVFNNPPFKEGDLKIFRIKIEKLEEVKS